ncbi:hypothetical protein AAC387_Pa08g1686 [Persea americana]
MQQVGAIVKRGRRRWGRRKKKVCKRVGVQGKEEEGAQGGGGAGKEEEDEERNGGREGEEEEDDERNGGREGGWRCKWRWVLQVERRMMGAGQTVMQGGDRGESVPGGWLIETRGAVAA